MSPQHGANEIKIYASPFLGRRGDWANNRYNTTWKTNVLEENYWDTIQKAINKAWVQGQNPYEAGLTNTLDGGNAKGALITNPETERLIAMTSTSYNVDSTAIRYTYFSHERCF